MESGRNVFNNNNDHSISNCGRLQGNNRNNNNDACPVWNPGAGTTPRIDWSCTNPPQSNSFNRATTMAAATDIATPVPKGGDGAVHALMANNVHQYSSPASCTSPFTTSCLYSSGVGVGGGMVGSQYCCYPDPHLMCLKLGKRHYFGDAATPLGDRQGAAVFSNTNANASSSKRGKPYYEIVGASTSGSGVTVAAAAPVVVPRCQVDGCHVPLVNAKDYHRRHKVCEMHSKAPKVVVLGLEQRFCQQCSRFHAVGEFDESKRSCRRRLAGHNERRRKSSQDQSTPRSHSHHQVHSKLMTYGGRHPYFPLNNGCALSLLSSKNDSWISSADLPARCSAALRELIAENRAAILSRQLILDKDLPWHHHHQTEDYMNGRQNGSNSLVNYQQQMGTSSHTWGRTTSEAGGHLTLDLMQAPNSAFGFLSVRGKSKEDEECPDLWGTFGGANVV